MSNIKTIIALTGLIGALVAKTTVFTRLSFEQVNSLAHQMCNKYFPNVDPKMLVTMAQIESSFNPHAFRYERHLNDSSVGLMQTLLKTAQWLAIEMGYTAYGVPTYQDLLNSEVSMYFGGAYVNWLKNYAGESRSEEWIVESYNGGPKNSNDQTQNHLRKYKKAKIELFGEAQ